MTSSRMITRKSNEDGNLTKAFLGSQISVWVWCNHNLKLGFVMKDPM
jgi:hypothetical protein